MAAPATTAFGHTTQSQARSSTIDMLRGLSAVSVALFHFNAPYAPLQDPYHRLVAVGWLGVPVFFVLSGYCIAAARAKSDYRTYGVRRFLRIYPPYWASVLLVLLLACSRVVTTGTNDVTPIPQTIGGWFWTALALTSPATPVPGMNWAYWSLGYEIAFYAILGISAIATSPRLLVLISAAAFFAPRYPFDLWWQFGLGIACHRFASRHDWTAAVLATICLGTAILRQNWLPGALAAGTALLLAFPPRIAHWRGFRPLTQLGTWSYSLYLIHVPIGCHLVSRYMSPYLSRTLWPSLVHDGLALIVCVGFAYVFHRAIERPAHEFARSWRMDATQGPARDPGRTAERGTETRATATTGKGE